MNILDEHSAVANLIRTIHTALEELAEASLSDGENDFRRGQKYAYAECLEVLQQCPALRRTFLNYDIEKRHRLV